MERMFKSINLGQTELVNRFVFPPIKLGYGNPDGTVTDRQLTFYRRIAEDGPGILILEPVSVTAGGREHPRQLSVHLPESATQLKKIVDVIHDEGRRVCLHLNHAGGAANPKAAGEGPKAPSPMTCPTTQQTSESLSSDDIRDIVFGFRDAAQKALEADVDLIEIQGGHGYLMSQFLNRKINRRDDPYGEERLLFAKEVLAAVRTGAPDIPLIARISGNEMSPEFGIGQDDLLPFLTLLEENGFCAVHVGMGSSCFSPPWYFHHASLPEKPQMDALAWVNQHTKLPIIAAGRMGRKEKIVQVLGQGVADLVALGRPLLADPDLIEKWRTTQDSAILACGYCLQGCLHRLKNGEPLGCNLNPTLGLPDPQPSENPVKVLIAGGGPAGMSAALYLSKAGHQVTLAEKSDHLGGQFSLAWQAPGKASMKQGLEGLEHAVEASQAAIVMNREVDADLVREQSPDLLVWAVGAMQNIPEIDGLDDQNILTSIEYFSGATPFKGPRILVIGAGRTGLEIAEKLGNEGYEVVATKRTDPIGSMMEMITRNLALMRIGKMEKVTLMPHTTVKTFTPTHVKVEKDGEQLTLEPFQTVILASGMLSSPGPDEDVAAGVPHLEVIGDAEKVQDIFAAVHAGYDLAMSY